jgi:hypothetical protein
MNETNANEGATMAETTTIETERHTYDGWTALGRQVKRGERRGNDGKFAFSQTKAKGGSRGPRACAQCGCRLNYGMYCGKCEYGR